MTMLQNINMFMCLQPNKAIMPLCADFIVGGFSVSLRPSLPMLTMIGSNASGLGHGPRFTDAYTAMPMASGVQSRKATQLDNRRRITDMPQWYTSKTVFNNLDIGKHYSRPDGLPHSPPPKLQRRCEKEGGETGS